MKVQSEIRANIGVLVALQLVLALAAVGLLARMSPSVDTVVQENVYSVQASLDMMVSLSDSAAVSKDEFLAALGRARANITETEEERVISEIENSASIYFSGDIAEKARVIEWVSELARINQEVIVRQGKSVQSMGIAGAWTAVLLAVFGLVFSIIAVRRVSRRILMPLVDIKTTVSAYLA